MIPVSNSAAPIMKRDMEVIRRILAEAEATDSITKIEDPTVAYNVLLADEAGLLKAEITRDSLGRPTGAFVRRLTWAGHDFLDAARNDTIWNKAKKKILTAGVSWTFSLLLDYLKSEAHGLIFGAEPPAR